MKEYQIHYYQRWNSIKLVRIIAKDKQEALRKLRESDTCVEVISVRVIG